jgi:hypothetical protein
MASKIVFKWKKHYTPGKEKIQAFLGLKRKDLFDWLKNGCRPFDIQRIHHANWVF